MFRKTFIGLFMAFAAIACMTIVGASPVLAHSAYRAHHKHHAAFAPSLGIRQLVIDAARRHGVPVALQLAIVQTESGFNPSARNGRSLGLGQIQPPTARDAGCRGSLFNAFANADCSARIMAILLRDSRGNWRSAAAHYNQGRYARGSAGAAYARLVLGRARKRWAERTQVEAVPV